MITDETRDKIIQDAINKNMTITDPKLYEAVYSVALDVMGMYETERKKPKIGRGSRGPNRGGLPK